MAQSILVVDDEDAVRDVVGRYLERDGYDVVTADSGTAALTSFEASRPDLIVLDLMLPGLSGEAVCRKVRRDSDVPIIMLTARTSEVDRLMGLELGADDYVVKPFSPRELVARIKAVLRRTTVAESEPSRLVMGDLEVDGERRTVSRDGVPLTLTAREFDLLWFLAKHPGHVFSSEELLEHVWGWEFEGDVNTVTVHVRRLRTKIEVTPKRPRHLTTVWAVGYRFDA